MHFSADANKRLMSTIEFNDALIRLESYLKAFALSFTRDPQDASDLTQETLLKAISYRDQYVAHTNFKAWVFTIMRNIFINQYRRKTLSRAIFDQIDAAQLSNLCDRNGNADQLMVRNELNERINQLNAEFRQPFELHFHGYRYHEISEQLNIPIGTVKSRIFTARKKLMSLLPDYA